MFKKSYYLFSFFIFIISIFIVQILYIDKTKRIMQEIIATKKLFVKVTSLPDLALSTEVNYMRHRSLSDIFSRYKDDGTLREYAPSSYTYSPSKVLYEK